MEFSERLNETTSVYANQTISAWSLQKNCRSYVSNARIFGVAEEAPEVRNFVIFLVLLFFPLKQFDQSFVFISRNGYHLTQTWEGGKRGSTWPGSSRPNNSIWCRRRPPHYMRRRLGLSSGSGSFVFYFFCSRSLLLFSFFFRFKAHNRCFSPLITTL